MSTADLGPITERVALVLEAQKTWGERAAHELAAQLGVTIPSSAQPVQSVRGEQKSWPTFMVRLPPDLKRWIAEQAAQNGSSQNSEIVRCIRERCERVESTQAA